MRGKHGLHRRSGTGADRSVVVQLCAKGASAVTDRPPLTAPAHVIGNLSGTSPDNARRRADRRAFIETAAANGYSISAVARALGINRGTLARDYRSIFRTTSDMAPPAPDPAPVSDRTVIVFNAGGKHNNDKVHSVSLPLVFGACAGEVAADPRPETAPRGSHMMGARVERSGVAVSDVIEMIRAELEACRRERREG